MLPSKRSKHHQMAYRTFSLYNIDAPVGKGAANSPSDVRLIQGLLALVCDEPRMKPYMVKLCLDKKLGKLPPLPMANGCYNADTEFWILAFQYMVNERVRVKIDGVIDPMPKEGLSLELKAGPGRQYALAHLNKLALFYNTRGFVDLGLRVGAPYVQTLDGQRISA